MIYAVNKRTKEHELKKEKMLYDPDLWWFIEADKDGWIEWNGGVCPLSDGSRFDAKTRGGTQHPGCRGWRWDHKDVVSDIIAYRPILNEKPQAPGWDGEGLPPVGTVCEKAPYWHKCEIIASHDGGLVIYDMHILDYYKVGFGMDFRPIRTDREKWINQAADVALQTGDALGNIYDALKSGDLPQP